MASLIKFVSLSVLCRLPILFVHMGHYDAGIYTRAGMRVWTEGVYSPSRGGGSLLYESIVGALRLLTGVDKDVWWLYSNPLSAISVGVTLWVFYQLAQNWLSAKQSLALVLLYNFFPHTYVMGGATADINFTMMFLISSVWMFTKNKLGWAIFLTYLALACRIQSIMLAFPLVLVLLKRDWEAKDVKWLLLHAAICLAGVILNFLPGYLTAGDWLFKTADWGFSPRKMWFTWAYRLLNLFGPIGLYLLIYSFFTSRKKWFPQLKCELGFVISFFTVASLALLRANPTEGYYFMPVVPVLFTAFFIFEKRIVLLSLFAVSTLLPNIIQIRSRPWNIVSDGPLYDIRIGVVEAHIKQDWFTRQGG